MKSQPVQPSAWLNLRHASFWLWVPDLPFLRKTTNVNSFSASLKCKSSSSLWPVLQPRKALHKYLRTNPLKCNSKRRYCSTPHSQWEDRSLTSINTHQQRCLITMAYLPNTSTTFLLARPQHIKTFLPFVSAEVSSISLLYLKKEKSEVAQSCPTVCNPVDCSLPGFSIHGILQARILEWGAISFSRGSFQPKDRTWVSCIAGRRFTLKPPGKPLLYWNSLDLSCSCQVNSGSIFLWESLVFSL